jgi:hypothetical protein
MQCVDIFLEDVTWSQPLLLSSWIAPWKATDVHWKICQERSHICQCIVCLNLEAQAWIKALHTTLYKLATSYIRTTPLRCVKYLYIGKAAWFWFMFQLETDDWPVSCFRCLFSDLRAILDKEWNRKFLNYLLDVD